jgi:hypothetical protein
MNVNTEMILDLSEYTKGKRLLSGRENGKADYEKLVRQPDHAVENCCIIIRNDGGAIITNSYFLGMLTPLFNHFKTKDDLLKHINFEGLNDTNRMELLRGINRGYSKVRNAMAD